jgi:hypothetical protein
MYRQDVADKVLPELRVKFALAIISGLCLAHRSDYEVGKPLVKTSDELAWALNESILALTGAILSAQHDGNAVTTSEWWEWVGAKLKEICTNAGPASKRIEHDLGFGINRGIHAAEIGLDQ